MISTPQKVKLALLAVKVTCNNDKTAKTTAKALAFDINIVSDISRHTDYSMTRIIITPKQEKGCISENENLLLANIAWQMPA